MVPINENNQIAEKDKLGNRISAAISDKAKKDKKIDEINKVRTNVINVFDRAGQNLKILKMMKYIKEANGFKASDFKEGHKNLSDAANAVGEAMMDNKMNMFSSLNGTFLFEAAFKFAKIGIFGE